MNFCSGMVFVGDNMTHSIYLEREKDMNRNATSTATIHKSEPQTFWSAWQRIKKEKRCSTQAAMSLAQDEYPELYSKFLNACKRQKR